MNPQPTQTSVYSSIRIFFGGSFDPPHRGHVDLAEATAQSYDSSQLIFVPAARSPFKETHPTADHHRVSMLEIALQDISNWNIWKHELERAELNPNTPSYWADTWNAVHLKYPTGTNKFLIGADQAISMHRWKRYSEFWKDAIVMLRLEANTESSIDFNDQRQLLVDQLKAIDIWSENDLEHWKSRVIQTPMIDASSTCIRSTLADPQTRVQPINGLDARVQEYILAHDLYRKA